MLALPRSARDGTSRRCSLALALTASAFVSAACARMPAAVGPTVPLEVQALLLCDECSDGELAAVVGMGSSALPFLSSALYGLSPEQEVNARVMLSGLWSRAAAYRNRRGEPPAVTEAGYIRRNMSNMVALVEKRAAAALVSIGGGDAEDALRAALDDHLGGGLALRPDVIQAYRDALAQF